ncbi:MAG: alpha/beta hydrolase fold domain-containing protein [Pseudomonadota bacterium]
MTDLPGKLGNPEATFETDPRADRRIAAAMAMLGALGGEAEPISPDAPYEELLAYCQGFEDASAEGNAAMWEMMPNFDDIEETTQVIQGVDGNDIMLYIHRPKGVTGPLPCVVHTHGGGMVLMTAADPMFCRLRNTLARSGLVVVGVEFRNGGGRLGPHPFPAGLNDCAVATRWVYANREDLGVGKIVISGESGGGNLCIATTLKAKQEGWMDEIAGVYAMCPYISGQYADPPHALTSLRENDGYMLDCAQMAALVRVYDPQGTNNTNPLAWPLHSRTEDLAGLPPHVISVNELDPLRDEGLAFYRKLLAAGVPSVGRTVMGTPHAGDQMMPDVTPDISNELINSISGFARAL